MNMRLTLVLLVVVLTISSCDKRLAKKFSGEYTCELERISVLGGETTEYPIENTNVEVKKQGSSVEVFNWKIHVDSLRNERLYKEVTPPSSYKEIQFEKNALYLKFYNGGLGGSNTYIYNCTK
jgi:hypothetical protein